MKRTLLFLQNGTECKTVSKLEDTFASHGLDIDYRWAYDGDFPNDLSAYSRDIRFRQPPWRLRRYSFHPSGA